MARITNGAVLVLLYAVIVIIIITAIIYALFKKSRLLINIHGSPYPVYGEIKVFFLGFIPFSIKIETTKNHKIRLRYRNEEREYSIKSLFGKKDRKNKNKVSIKDIINVHSIRIIIRQGLKSEPVFTAISCGSVNAILAFLYIPVRRLNKKCRYNFKVYPYFDSNKICISAYCIITIRIADIMHAAIINRIRSAGNGKASNREYNVIDVGKYSVND
ncbi:MAG TPA: DUF2953 domain-containing protein [Clostridia bacterium]|nr:DUF2953 domain-containing protein [Clostridia bacterium]